MIKLRMAALLAAAAVIMPTAASAEWLQAKTRHFIIYSDDSRDGLKAYAEKLEKFDNAVRRLRGMRDAPVADSNKVTIYVVRGTEEINRLLGTGGGVGGYYFGRASGPVAFVPKTIGTGNGSKFEFTPDIIFFHEYSHHMQLQEAQVALPAWMVEGYAEFYGTTTMRPDGSLVIGAPANTRSQALHSDDLPLDAMLTGGLEVELVSPLLFYGKSWLLTHYLAFSKPREGQLTTYLKNIHAGQPALAAATNAFGDLKKLNSEMFRYMRSEMPQMVIPASALNAGPVEVRPLRAGEVEAMKIRHQTETGVTRAMAPKLAATAAAIAARYPNDPAVLYALAEAQMDAREFAAAAATAQKVIALDPRHADALVIRGRALTGLALTGGDKANWAEARKLFNQASAIDPEAAEPMYRLYQSYELAGEKPNALATSGLMAAFIAVPQDDGLRIDLVRQLVRDRRFAEAATLFSAVVYDPHLRGKTKEKATRIMAAIKVSNGAAALAIFDEIEAEAKKKAKARPGDDA